MGTSKPGPLRYARGYNISMRFRCTFALLLLSTILFAQSAPAPCPADRPVDDILAEIHSQQSKKKNRNSNPLPTVTCVFGWCRDHSKTPPTLPPPAQQPEVQGSTDSKSDTASSNKDPVAECNDAMERALEAARDVEVGDYSFEEKNYHGAQMRYQDAANWKPQDAAIHVRLGRVYEKLRQFPQAIEEYTAAEKFPGPPKWVDEAKAALQRLNQ